MAVVNTRLRGRGGGAVSARRIMVIGAHSADFVWRAGGAMRGHDRRRRRGRGDRAVLRRAGRVGRAVEGGGPDDRERQEGPPRRGGGARRSARRDVRAAWTSATTRSQIDSDALLLIADAIREFAPDVLITHTDTDPFNPDHPVAYAAVESRARAGRRRRRVERVRDDHAARAVSCSSPTSPSCATSPRTTFVDITAVLDAKLEAMAEMKAQEYLQTYYAQRAEQRGNHARRVLRQPGDPPGRGVPAGDPAAW